MLPNQQEKEADNEEGSTDSVGNIIRQYVEEAKLIQSLGKKTREETYDSPVDINLTHTKPIQLDPLLWTNYDVTCKKMKMTNTGHTLLLSASWAIQEPYLTGGPLLGNYIFSQLHFHWGKNNMEGSEHTFDGGHLPLEMHVVHFNSVYLKQEYALSKPDGIVVLGYLFKLQAEDNPEIQIIMESIGEIQVAHSCTRLPSIPLGFLVPQFQEDYFVYWGSIQTHASTHTVLWLISREPVAISISQMDDFRRLYNEEEEPLLRNFREVKSLGERKIFHVNPSGLKHTTLLQMCSKRNDQSLFNDTN